MKEIESDGFITRDEDVSPIGHTCFNCKWFKFDIGLRAYKCTEGHIVNGQDWRQKYSICDLWEGKR